ncbi:MAG: AIR synthase-related protein, partial [Paracoccaceae bacterium]
DLETEARNGQFIRDNRDMIRACSDLSDGGLAMAAFEMAAAGQTGVILDSDATPDLFGEDQARYLVACNFDQAEYLMMAAGRVGVAIQTVGRFAGDVVRMGGSETPLADLVAVHTGALAEHFA